MGPIAKAKCSRCGFDSGELFLEDTGLYGYTTKNMEPAICPQCKKFVVADYLKKPLKCTNCGNELVFYNNPAVRKPSKKSSHSQNFELFSKTFLCPKCNKIAMKFTFVGLWD